MLILTRGEGEAIQIGDSIRLWISSVRDGKVRIGIEAPRDVLVLREELLPSPEERGVASSANRTCK